MPRRIALHVGASELIRDVTAPFLSGRLLSRSSHYRIAMSSLEASSVTQHDRPHLAPHASDF